jgi:toxin ParE1/3/4
MNIRWLEDAINDLQALRQYINQDSPKAANNITEKLISAVELLSENPGLGRQGRVVNTRELIISSTSYIVPYRIKHETVEVLRVYHCAMKWPEEL